MKRLVRIGVISALTFSFSSFVAAQDTTTTTITKKEVVVNQDGSYSVIEYPVGKEVVVDLTPYNIEGAKGLAKVMRMQDGTTVTLDLSGLPADAKNYYVYAVDNSGKVSLLGPTVISNGVSNTVFKTPMDKFMLVLSPTENLSAIESSTPVVFRSAVPTGYAVVPTAVTSPEGNKQVAASTEVSSTYQVPMLGISNFTKTTEIRINFTGDLQGLKGKAYVDPTKDGLTKIKMRFDDMKMAPKDKRYVLWASSADGKYTKIGQVVNMGKRQESEIRGETSLTDFGLFVTVEDAEVTVPTSKVYSVFSVK